MTRPALRPVHRAVVVVHLALAAVLAVVGLAGASGSEGWTDVVRVVVGLLVGGWLLGLLVGVLVARLALAGSAPRLLVLLASAPAGLGVVVALARLA